jgi:RHS repeat-associated protein
MFNKFATTFERLLLACAALCCSLMALPGHAAQGPAAYTTAVRFNLNQQVTAVIRPSPDGSASYPATRNLYDSKGLLVQVDEGVLNAWQDETIEPANWSAESFIVARRMVYTYDEVGRRRTESVGGPDGAALDAVSLTQLGYDELDRLKCRTVRMNPAAYTSLPDACDLGLEGAAGPDRITQYQYKIAHLVLTEKRGLTTEFEQTYLENRYGVSGSYLVSDQLDANGNLTHYDYDGRGRLKRMYFPQALVAPNSGYNSNDYEEYGLDANGNRTLLKKRDGRVISYAYDGLNRVLSRQLTSGSGVLSPVFYGYDLLGNQQYARFGSDAGAGVTKIHNGFGELAAETTNVSGVARTLTYRYDLNGNRTRVTHPDNASFTYRYDQLDRLADVLEDGVNGAVLVSQRYDELARLGSRTTVGSVVDAFGYDAASRPRTIGFDAATSAYDLTHTLTYNPAAQIATRELSNSNFQYVEKGSAVGAYLVNGLNQYTQVGDHVFDHDDNGNLSSDGTTVYEYDAENRLIKAAGAATTTLGYDPLGRLVSVAPASSAATAFLYSGDSLVAEYQNGVMVRRYVFGTGRDRPLVGYDGAQVGGANRHFIHANHQGSAIAITDNAGKVLSVNTYDAYGVPGVSNKGRFGYTGQLMLPELGMYYYKARVYYPRIGRFLQTDPVDYQDDMGLYTYVGNDPVNMRDPDGRQAQALLCFNPVTCAGVIVVTGAIMYYAHLMDKQRGRERADPFRNELVQSSDGEANSEGERKTGESNVRDNNKKGIKTEDEVASDLEKAGRDVERQVRKETPFGPRIIDIEVSDKDGNVLGGVEVKAGNSRYRADQRSKDEWLRQNGYPVDLVRKR